MMPAQPEQTIFQRLRGEYRGLRSAFAKYWSAYGGVWALLCSPYLHIALVSAFLCWKRWSKEGWWDDVLVVIPSLLGFTLGGLAIFLSVGDLKFRRFLASPRSKRVNHTLFVRTSASFMHFIVVQALALAYALLAQGTNFYVDKSNMAAKLISTYVVDYHLLVGMVRPLFWIVGYWVFVYAVFCALAAAHSTFMLTRWYDMLLQREKGKPEDDVD